MIWLTMTLKRRRANSMSFRSYKLNKEEAISELSSLIDRGYEKVYLTEFGVFPYGFSGDSDGKYLYELRVCLSGSIQCVCDSEELLELLCDTKKRIRVKHIDSHVFVNGTKIESADIINNK